MSLILVVFFDLRLSPRLSENDPNAIFRGLGEMGEDDSRKKPEAKNPLTPSISCDTFSSDTFCSEYYLERCLFVHPETS